MLDEMRTFVVLAESGSLQRAAERLFLMPSAVTRQIQRLEAALKTPLLDRRVKPDGLPVKAAPCSTADDRCCASWTT